MRRATVEDYIRQLMSSVAYYEVEAIKLMKKDYEDVVQHLANNLTFKKLGE